MAPEEQEVKATTLQLKPTKVGDVIWPWLDL
jgi:hypothetical protein